MTLPTLPTIEGARFYGFLAPKARVILGTYLIQDENGYFIPIEEKTNFVSANNASNFADTPMKIIIEYSPWNLL